MILFFSGTGNSEYAAKRIGKAINDDAVDLFGKIRSHDYSQLHSEKPWVIVVPTYAWRIPRIVQEWLENTALTGNRSIYFVMTCGGSIGNAGAYLEKLCNAKKLDFCGCMEVVMPENYIAMYSAPAQDEALEIIRRSEKVMDEAALLIKSGKVFPRPAVALKDKISSGIVLIFFIRYSSMPGNFMLMIPAFPAANAFRSVPWTISACQTENLYGVRAAPTAWPVSAAALRKRLNTENTVRA